MYDKNFIFNLSELIQNEIINNFNIFRFNKFIIYQNNNNLKKIEVVVETEKNLPYKTIYYLSDKNIIKININKKTNINHENTNFYFDFINNKLKINKPNIIPKCTKEDNIFVPQIVILKNFVLEKNNFDTNIKYLPENFFIDFKDVYPNNIEFCHTFLNTNDKAEYLVLDKEDILPFIVICKNRPEKELFETEKLKNLIEYIIFARNKICINKIFKVILLGERTENMTSGVYEIGKYTISNIVNGRRVFDIARTITHELVHLKQDLLGKFKNKQNIPIIGGKIEDQANIIAANLVKYYGIYIKQEKFYDI